MNYEEFNTLKALMEADRSIRCFDNSRGVEIDKLKSAVGLASLCASGRNLQPLRYLLATGEMARAICAEMKWAGYLTDWAGPSDSELPPALILQCLDTRLTKDPMCDEGLQLQAITLGLTAQGLGNCIVKSFNKAKVREIAKIEDYYEICYIVATGYRAEKVIIEKTDTSLTADIKYWRDAEGRHHVPKRFGLLI